MFISDFRYLIFVRLISAIVEDTQFLEANAKFILDKSDWDYFRSHRCFF